MTGRYASAACLAEGAAEQAVMDILLDHDLLIFKREDLIDRKVLRFRSAEKFEQRYLRKGFSGPITIYRILDSRRENFSVSRAYRHLVKVINVITAPEIEMLIILNEGCYEHYKRSGQKPSEFCKSILKLKEVKNYDFVKNYFSDPDVLVYAIREYTRISKIRKDEDTLQDLLK